MIPVLLHGLGRFGQHVLHAWLASPGSFSLEYACDAQLDVGTVCHLLQNHDRLDFTRAEPAVAGNQLLLTRADGVRHSIDFFTGPAPEAPWLGKPTMWLECSGRYTQAAAAAGFCCGATRQVLVSATSPDADQTIVMGLNEADYSAKSRVISYGSCTVNAFVPLADYLHRCFMVREAEVHVIHNVPCHRLVEYPQPVRTSCTLEAMAPNLLPWLPPERFFVCYTMIPYTGPSLVDFRFELGSMPNLEDVRQALYCPDSSLAPRYRFPVEDCGVGAVAGQPYNAVIPRDGINLVDDCLRLRGYFDNENSAVRYMELVELAARAHAGAA